MKAPCALASIALLCICAEAGAYEFRCRWVERVGGVDYVIDPAGLSNLERAPRGLRLQFGVFDDELGGAPAGGLIGWNLGVLSIGGETVNTRTPGRMSPFNFSGAPFANGCPTEDPFTLLTRIDATLGTQSPYWGFDANGDPLPQPDPRIRGLNSYVSVYGFTTDPSEGSPDYSIEASGVLIAASEWRAVGTPSPPDPVKMLDGSVTYAPVPLEPVMFSCALNVFTTPAPGAGALLGVVGVFAARRRRG